MAHIRANQNAISGIGLVAECLSETRKLLMRESARFHHTETGHRPPRLSRRHGFLPAQGPDPISQAILCGQATKWVHRSLSVLGQLKGKLRASSGQAYQKVQVRGHAV